ncbi:MAG: hypothetical protein DELT_01129 [Desulfovibrio sp.]
MRESWKVLRGEKNVPPQKTEPAAVDTEPATVDTKPVGEMSTASGEFAGETPVTVGETPVTIGGAVPDVVSEPRSGSRTWLIVMLCVGCLAVFGLLFREEVRGFAAWAAAKSRGHDVSLTSKAPGLGKLMRFGKKYSLEEFLALCVEGKPASVEEVLRKQPDLLIPRDGTTILHLAVERSVNPEVFGLLVQRVPEGSVNAPDVRGRTPLHVAADSGALPGFILALRGAGASIFIRDNAGNTPVDAFFASPYAKPVKLTLEEKGIFRRYGHNRTIGYDKNGKPKTIFEPLADQVPLEENKRYFSQLAHARAFTRDTNLPALPFASGDVVTVKRREMAPHAIMQAKMRGTYREPLTPLWKEVEAVPDTGTALARLKCLLSAAYPSSLNYFSARMAGQNSEPKFAVEWNAWEVPGDVRGAIMLETLRQRLAKRFPKQPEKPGTYTFSSSQIAAQSLGRAVQERGDNPNARNPLLMTWILLEYGTKAAPEALPPLLMQPEAQMKKQKKEGVTLAAVDELANLRALHSLLSDEVWRSVGRHLVAAAYAADKRRDTQWGAGFMPRSYKEKGGLAYIRLWGCDDMTDLSEPLRRVLAVTDKVSLQLAKAMVTLVLRSGPQSTARDKDGKPPLEYAKGMNVPAPVLTLLRVVPVYEPPVTGKRGEPEEGANTPAVPERKGQPLGAVRHSTI